MNFQRLNVWIRSKDLSVSIYKTLFKLKDWGFKDQITRSGLSIPSNIAEGMERHSDIEKIRFLNIAQASCAELRTQIIIGSEVGYIPLETASLWQKEATEISAMIEGLIKSIRTVSP